MLANVLTKALRDRATSIAVGGGVVALFLVLAMAAYQQVDVSVYTDLPEAIRSVMGIPGDADPAVLAYDVILGMVGALTLGGLGVSVGASAVAGEERDGTIGLLLGNPRSRRHVVAAKGGAMLGLLATGGLVVLAACLAAPVVLGVDVGGVDVVAACLHMTLNAALWGALALAVGAATGNRAMAAGLAGGLMVLAWFLSGLLPISASLDGVARALPWWWSDGHDPLRHGFAGGWAALQVATTGALLGFGWWRVEHRDLRAGRGTAALLDRLRQDPRADRVLDALAGTSQVGSVRARALGEGRALVLVVALVMFSMMGLLMGPMYAALEDTFAEAAASLPDALLAIAGGGDLATPEGWYRVESLGLMAPIAAALAAARTGVTALAGEERDRTMGLLLANPVSRRQVVLDKAVAVVAHAGVVAGATFLGISGGSLIAGLGMSVPHIAAACVHLWFLGTLFGMVALAAGAVTGQVRAATLVTIGLVFAAYLANTLLLLVSSLEAWTIVSPFDWYLGHEPLVTGLDAGRLALLAGASAAALALAVLGFDRRDLHQG